MSAPFGICRTTTWLSSVPRSRRTLRNSFDLAVVLRDEVEQVGIEMDARGAPTSAMTPIRRREDGDLFAVPEAELGESIEDVGQSNGREIDMLRRTSQGLLLVGSCSRSHAATPVR